MQQNKLQIPLLVKSSQLWYDSNRDLLEYFRSRV